jgi:hypothetical protein
MHISKWFGIILATTLLAAPAQAQDNGDGEDGLGETLEQVGELYGKPYVQPLVDGIGADLNSGLFQSADVSGGMLPLVDVYVGLKGFGAFVGSGSESFDLQLEDGESFQIPNSDGEEVIIDGDQTLEDLPTFFGTDQPGERELNVRGRGGFNETVEFEPIQGFLQTSVTPLAAPHVEIGSSVIGTSLTLRYIPHALSAAYQDYGSIGMYGVGVRHDIGQYVPLLPMSLAAQVMYQNVNVRDTDDAEVLAINNWAGNVAVSKSFFVATIYGGLQLESAGVTVDYDIPRPNSEPIPINYELNGANSVRALAGVSIHPGPVAFNVDFSLASVPVITAGVGLTL